MGHRFRRIALLSVVGIIAAAGAGTAYAARSSSGHDYRLATVTSADVTAALHEVGTITPVREADVAFSVGGTVASVAVKPGQHVTAGQTLGSLDTTSLRASLTAAQSTLANANLRVDTDMTSQNTAAGGSATSPAAQPTPSLRPLQQAVLGAQRAADSALARARTALGQARKACAALSSSPPPSPSPAPTPTAPTPTAPTPTAPTPTAPASTAPTPTGPADAGLAATGTARPSPAPRPGSCPGATQRVLDAETAVLRAQQALSGRLTALSQALSKAVAAAGKSSGTGGGAGGADPVSATQLAADQASADAAAAQVTLAQQDLAAATAVSPVSGTVVTVSVTAGASAGAGDPAFAVAGLNSYEVVTEVGVNDMPDLKTGQRASVQPDGRSTPISGAVASIGLLPDSTGSSVTYPVTIRLTGHYSGLHAGDYAGVTITTAQGLGVSVPTSAVHYAGQSATVVVYAGGKTRIARVTVGTKGPVFTRITAGLRVGQQVVLADLNKPLPTDTVPGAGGGPGPGARRFVFVGG